MTAKTETRSTGPGFLGLLAILFIGLKLGGVIDWSWWLVLLPLYGPLALVLTIFAVIVLAIGAERAVSKALK